MSNFFQTSVRKIRMNLKIVERLATLERDRNSRWKKIMRMLAGSRD